jgi:hypothetical protein
MKIVKKAVVKQILTETSKAKMFEKFLSQQNRLRKECEQLRFESRRSEKSRNVDKGLLRRKFHEEIESRQEKIDGLQNKIEQLEILTVGSELHEREVQTVVEVNVGDDWQQTMNEPTIVVKDGKVAEIRGR